MEAKLIINGKELMVNISEEELHKITKKACKPTGYERVAKGERYWSVDSDDDIDDITEAFDDNDNNQYDAANYYSDETVADNNARADRLLRRLRRFAVKHRETNIDWKNEDCNQRKYYLYYSYYDERIEINLCYDVREFGQIYFDKKETAQLAIDTFKNELIWYFTEYKDSL